MTIAQPTRFQQPGSYRTKWAIRRDAGRSSYRIELLDFVKRQ